MMRKNDAATAGQSVPAELHNIELGTSAPSKRRAPRIVCGIAVTVLVAALAFGQTRCKSYRWRRASTRRTMSFCI